MTAANSNTPSAEQQSPDEETIHHLTGFQRDILVTVSKLEDDDTTPYGLAIKRHLESLYDDDINHGRLYPNLDELVTDGYIDKGRIDDRTNSYTLTELGINTLETRKAELKSVL